MRLELAVGGFLASSVVAGCGGPTPPPSIARAPATRVEQGPAPDPAAERRAAEERAATEVECPPASRFDAGRCVPAPAPIERPAGETSGAEAKDEGDGAPRRPEKTVQAERAEENKKEEKDGPPREKAAADRRCSELECALDPSLPCCARKGKASSSVGAASVDAGGLTPVDIKAGLASSRAAVASCYERYKVAGTVRVKIVVLASGSPASAAVEGDFAGTPTGACVELAVMAARFKPAPSGSAFVYPFELR